MTNIDQLEERYLSDTRFSDVVTLFYRFICNNNFTISEIKDALFIAGLKYEHENGGLNSTYEDGIKIDARNKKREAK